MTRPDQTRPDQTRPDQTRPDQTRPDQTYAQNSRRKILLVTLYGNYNYGNILQRCALTSVLESHGFEVEHLCESDTVISVIKKIIKRILAALGIPKYRKQEVNRRLNEPKEKRFKSFQDKYTGKKIFMTYKEALSESQSRWEEYDYAITGSDQVWHNWNRTPKELAFYYLEFMPENKRINYAQSFGFSEFSEADKELHRKGLQGFRKISCREEGMHKLIMNLTGQESQLVLDPTLLLRPEQWKNFASRPEYDLPEKYILCYFLGSITEEYGHAINEAAGGLPVIHVYDKGSPHAKKDSPEYLTHPGEFLYLFKHADFICTDSFHGTAFSINFGKNFLAFRRKQMNMENMFGRIESLLANTDLMNHVYESGMQIRPDVPDYEHVNQKLEAMRKASMQYLRECLKLKE